MPARSHDEPDLNVEPAPDEPAETFDEWLDSRPRTNIGSADFTLRLSKADEDPFRAGYARGYAVAVLRAVASWEMAVLPEFLQTMASDAADGLMA